MTSPEAGRCGRRPRPIEPGDTIGVFAPASPIQGPMLDAGVEHLRSLGYQVRVADDITARHRYLAGDDERRLGEWNALVDDPDVRLLWAARGGYGSGRLLEGTHWAALERDPRLIVGCSDITALHLGFRSRGLVALHGPMVASDGAADRAGLAEVLRIAGGVWPPAPLPPLRVVVEAEGAVEGPVVGGCLSLVAAAVGTPEGLAADGAIVFLEDQNERPYRLDRMLEQIRRSGVLRDARAVVFGEMPGCVQHAEQGYGLDDVLRALLCDLGIPVLAGLPSGHVSSGLHRTIALGCRARVSGDTLELLESPIAAEQR